MIFCFATAVAAFTLSIYFFVIYFIVFTIDASRTLSKKGVYSGSVFAVVTAQFVLQVFFCVKSTDATTEGAPASPLSLSVLPHIRARGNFVSRRQEKQYKLVTNGCYLAVVCLRSRREFPVKSPLTSCFDPRIELPRSPSR